MIRPRTHLLGTALYCGCWPGSSKAKALQKSSKAAEVMTRGTDIVFCTPYGDYALLLQKMEKARLWLRFQESIVRVKVTGNHLSCFAA